MTHLSIFQHKVESIFQHFVINLPNNWILKIFPWTFTGTGNLVTLLNFFCQSALGQGLTSHTLYLYTVVLPHTDKCFASTTALSYFQPGPFVKFLNASTIFWPWSLHEPHHWVLLLFRYSALECLFTEQDLITGFRIFNVVQAMNILCTEFESQLFLIEIKKVSLNKQLKWVKYGSFTVLLLLNIDFVNKSWE